DGYVDLYIVNGSTIANHRNPGAVRDRPRNYLFRNNGDGTFSDVTLRAGVEGTGWGNGAVAADYNNDGLVDLFVYNFGKNILYRNNGDGSCAGGTAKPGVVHQALYYRHAVSFEDLDGDGRRDIVVLNDSNPNYHYHHKADVIFEELRATAGIAYNHEGVKESNMGLAI